MDSCVNQILAIDHETYESVDNRIEPGGIFFDILKVFKV